MKKSILSSLVAASALFSATAFAGGYVADSGYTAADTSSMAESQSHSMLDGFYAGIGTNHTANTTSKTSNDGVVSNLDTTDFGWNIFAGRKVNEYLAFELGYSSFGDNTFENADEVTTADYYNTWIVSALGKVMSPSYCGISAYFKAGVAYLNQESNLLQSDNSTLHSDYAAGTLAYGFGLQYSYDKFDIALDWLRFQNNNSNGSNSSSNMYFPDQYSLNVGYNF